MLQILKKGDPVILHPLISGTDGTCLDCRRGNDMHAAAGAFPGLSIKEGGYSELLKTSVRNLIKLPKVLAPRCCTIFRCRTYSLQSCKKSYKTPASRSKLYDYRCWWSRSYCYSMFKSYVCC